MIKITNKLDDIITGTDCYIAKINNITPEYATFQHTFNPLHVYCRLEQLGIPKDKLKIWIRDYERHLYSKVIQYMEAKNVSKK